MYCKMGDLLDFHREQNVGAHLAGASVTSGVLRCVGGFNPPPKFSLLTNSQFCGKYICNNQIIIRVSRVCKLSGTPD
jgi:hypothetical protein